MTLAMPINSFKQALRTGDMQLGAFLGLADAYSAELMANTTFDWLLIDAEHGPNDLRSILAQLQALAAYPVKPVVRAPDHNATTIKRLLDIGVQTLLLPMVESADQAHQLVRAMRYPPAGVRGVGGGLARATHWGRVSNYADAVTEQLCLLVQIESPTGLRELEAISAVDGVDGVFLGPADLAAALGYFGQPGHPEVSRVIEQALSRVRATGKPAGVYCADPVIAARYRELGASFFLIAADTILLRTAANAQVARFRS